MTVIRKSRTAQGHTSASRSVAALSPYLFVLPAVIFVVAFLLMPMVYTLWQSFTDADGLRSPSFVGLKNYLDLFTSPNFTNSLRNTLIWVVASVVLPVGLAFALALALERVVGGNFFRTALYLPSTLAAAAAGVMFSFIFDPTSGVLNAVLGALGFHSLSSTEWLYRSPLNTWAMIATYTWQSVGANLMIFLIGLQSLPREPLEAAKIDGAAGLTFTRLITVPLMTPYITISALMAAVNGFKVFDLVWVMTQGGPARSSETLAVTMYREGFILFHQGASAAIAVVISLIALGFSYFYLRNVMDKESLT
ncbi:carbohydrate ABC transporter permease [Deinococcus sp.]|uniref:carbohydrate ABC transporter permease n=1 Tax=Deinococcus sp. TaxID=47478 RepID=UPI003CC5E7F1